MQRLLLLAFCCTLFTQVQAQSSLYVDTTITTEVMIMDFFDGFCVDITNISCQGSKLGQGYFESADTDLGLTAGILLTSGLATSAIGPNDLESTSTNMGAPGDPELESLIAGTTFDAAVIEFDLVSSEDDTLLFSYVFASEEYPEFVCSSFNDVFGFFVTGPAPDSGMYVNKNIAMIPDTLDPSGLTFTDLPVAINTVNDGIGSGGGQAECAPPYGSLDYSIYYVNNGGGAHLEYDGMTVPFFAPLPVKAGETYHIKIAVGDVADGIYDSAVFLDVESLCGDSLVTPVPDVQFAIAGNTLQLVNESRYATSYLWDFGDGNSSTERYPAPHTYTAPGDYTVSLLIENYCCSAVYTIGVPVGNSLSNDHVFCDVDAYLLEGTPLNVNEYGVWSILSGAGTIADPQAAVTELMQPGTGTTTVVWDIYSQTGEVIGSDTLTFIMSSEPESFNIQYGEEVSLCTGDDPYELYVFPAGGELSGSGIDDNGLFDPALAGPGTHQVTYTLTDSFDCVYTLTADIEVRATPPQPEIMWTDDGMLTTSVMAAGYIWQFNGAVIPGNSPVIAGVEDGTYQVTIVQNGCASEPSEPFLVVDVDDNILSDEGRLLVAPNPTTDLLTVQTLTGTWPYTQLRIYNLQGQLLMHKEVTAAPPHRIEVGHLPQGTYRMQAIGAESSRWVSFVKQ